MDKETQNQLRQLVRQNYEQIAEEFAQTRQRLRWPELERFTSLANESQTVLDVGCGDGRILPLLQNGYARYVGVEPSQGLAAIARARIEEKGARRNQAEILEGDILNLNELLSDKFDWVFCIAVLQHIPGSDLQLAALRQLRARLKDDGRIVVSVWRMWRWPKLRQQIIKYAWLKLLGRNRMDFGDIVFDWKRGPQSRRYYHAFSQWGLRRLIKQAGLRIEHWERGPKNHYLVLKK